MLTAHSPRPFSSWNSSAKTDPNESSTTLDHTYPSFGCFDSSTTSTPTARTRVSMCETGSTSSSNFSVMSMLSDKRERKLVQIGTNTVAWKEVAPSLAASPVVAAVDTEGSAARAPTLVAIREKSMATVVGLADERPTIRVHNVVEISLRNTTKVMTSSRHGRPDRLPLRPEQHQPSPPKRHPPSQKNQSRTCLILAMSPLPPARLERHQLRITTSGFCRAATLPMKTTTTLTISNLRLLRPPNLAAILWPRSHLHRQRRQPHQRHSLQPPRHLLQDKVPISTISSPQHLPLHRIRRRYCHRQDLG